MKTSRIIQQIPLTCDICRNIDRQSEYHKAGRRIKRMHSDSNVFQNPYSKYLNWLSMLTLTIYILLFKKLKYLAIIFLQSAGTIAG